MAAALEFPSVKYCLLFALLLISLCLKGGGASRRLSKEQVDDLEIERKLNKIPIKTIHTEWGDILDCFDINKQPAFDHPLLKDHKIQMNPSFSLEDDEKSSRTKSADLSSIFKLSDDEECPQGTVPILRTHKESSSIKVEARPEGHSLAGVRYSVPGETFYGAFAQLDVYNPKLTSEYQFSSAEIAVENGPDGIRVGWTVNPRLHGDNKTRIFTLWTTDSYQKTGCYDASHSCPGFVQLNKRIYPGIQVGDTSVLGGVQILIDFQLHQDKITGDWHLLLRGDTDDILDVGYWPKKLFGSLSGGCNQIYWGGNVKESASNLSPEMGSGQSPDDQDIDYTKACHLSRLQYSDRSGTFRNIKQDYATEVLECSGNCSGRYNAVYLGFKTDYDLGRVILFGGPGGPGGGA